MKKNRKLRAKKNYPDGDRQALKKILRMVRFTVFSFFLGLIQVLAVDSYSQMTRLSLNATDEVLENVLEKIEDESEFFFLYNKDLVDVEQKVNINAENETIKTILDDLFRGKDINYIVYDRQIVLSNKEVISKMADQKKTVSGKVVDSGGQPLPGVSVVVKGTTQGTVTNADGVYSISNVTPDVTLQFSFVGMKEQEIVVGGQSTIDVIMLDEAIGIEEVVAVGYGTQKKIDVVGSMASVSGDELTKIKVANIAQNLQGAVSGLMVSNTSGHPGSAPDIKIRGINSISLSSDPLWIVDGVPIYTDASQDTRDGVKPVSAISMLNPNDIESIQVLKDAAATAIYGNRASGGVILVTTKRVKEGTTSLSVSYDGGISQIPFSQNDIFVDSKTYWNLYDINNANVGLAPADPNSVINTKITGDKPSMTREEAIATNTDLLGSFTQNATFHQFGLSANKGFKDGGGGVMYSLSYRDEKGLIINNDLNRLTSRFSFNFKPVKSVDMGIASNFIYLKTNGVRDVGGKTYGGWSNWMGTLPWFKVYDENSESGYWAAASGYNMLANVDRDLQRYDTDEYRAINNAYIKWSPFDGFFIKGEAGVDLLVTNNSFWRSSKLNPLAPYYSYAEEQSITKYVVNYDVFANYTKTFNDIHNVDFTIGTEANRDWMYTRKFAGSGLQTAYPELINPLVMNSMKGYSGGDVYMMGFFARANYKLMDRYLLNASARRDGHSAFSEDNRWANFYAVGAGWILTNESFMQDLSFVSLLKLRGSYGVTGNTKVTNAMTYMQWTLDTVNNFGVPVNAGSTNIGPLGSSDLKWETTANLDLGFDYGLLDNRINGSFAYYTQKIKDLILLASVQPSVGLNQNFVYENTGDMKNWGVEFNVSSKNIVNKNFQWTTSFNISTNKNKIVSLNDEESGQGKIETTTIRKVGESLDTWFLSTSEEIDSQTGVAMIQERDQDVWANDYKTVSTGKLLPASESNSSNNRMIQHGKTPLPTYYGGITNTFNYKNFDLNIMLSFEGGNWVMNKLYNQCWRVGVENNVIKEIAGNSWEKPGDITKWPQVTEGIYYDNEMNPTTTKSPYGMNQTTFFLEKGDYLRARNIQLGYTLPRSVVDRAHLGGVRFYVGVNNLFTITGFKGLDPETNNDLPIPRTYNFGVSLNL
ncbi:MAG: TonB-dependent receptor [Draconibacterium sp.]